jgi:hypothetical protein
MNDKKLIITGLVIFLIAVTFPVWYSLAAKGDFERSKLELPADKSKCVEEKAYMASNHMKLLYDWRETLVRENKKDYTSEASGEKFEKSLTRTCLGCHNDRDKFCNKCHTYADVYPTCWGCHVDPKKDVKND